jgi:uncharacterized protein YjlB
METRNIQIHLLRDDGTYPNNAGLPVLIYPQAVELPVHDPASGFESLFSQHAWGGSWRNGVYPFHHYHSTAHEVLGVYSGTANVQLGGENGIVVPVSPSDVLLIPAGVAHKNLGASPDLGIVGAYPLGQRPDMCYGKSHERPQADERIAAVALPQADPVYGKNGPMQDHWKNRE